MFSQIEGNRGDLTQSSASDFDENTGVLFLTQLNRDGVACWNTKKPLSSESLGLVAQDKEALIFTNDLKVCMIVSTVGWIVITTIKITYI